MPHKYQIGERVSVRARWLRPFREKVVLVTVSAHFSYNDKWYYGQPQDGGGSHGKFFMEEDVVEPVNQTATQVCKNT
jgi:hypothetical protein